MDRIVIVGGGPAGASAATFTARAGVDTVVVDADKGMTRRAWVANHLGFADGVAGPDLVDQGRAQAETAGAAWIDGTAEAIERTDDGLSVRLDDGQVLEASSVILATGTSVALAEAAGATTADGTEPRIKRIVIVDGEGRTSVPGVWAAGTAAGVSVHTIITAGDGARVAINLLSERTGERHVDHDVLPAT
ncbi:MAG TPA: FAD-dependent oxidoreductase [Acidimicrobiales bacterium]|jgi:thioredoxin reductase|nr:FAD-dependent oxidoreductase [Acidimicrobiales bacterium]